RLACLSYLPGSHRLVGAVTDHSIHYEPTKEDQADHSLLLRNTAIAMAFAPDGSLGAALDDVHTIRFWDGKLKNLIEGSLQVPGKPRAIAFSEDSKSFHVLMEDGHYISRSIDMPRMRAEGCRLAETDRSKCEEASK